MRAGNSSSFVLASMGDSQTAARVGGASMIETYPARCARSKGFGTFINAGIAGNTTTMMLARFTADILKYWPSCVSLMGFVNDMTTNISGSTWVDGGIAVATTKANTKAMITEAQDKRARVTLLSPVPVFDTVYLNNAGPYLAALAEIVNETNCDYVGVYEAFIALDTTTRNSLLLDNQHPNSDGHAFIEQLALAVSGAFGHL